MRSRLTILATLLPLLVGLTAGAAQAAVSPLVIKAVVSNCPFKTNGVCADAVGDFLDLQSPGAERDSDIVKLVQALARAAKHPNITMPMCIELRTSIYKLGAAVTQPSPQQQIEHLAAKLCKGRKFAASVGGNVPVSLVEGSGDSSPPPTEPTAPLIPFNDPNQGCSLCGQN